MFPIIESYLLLGAAAALTPLSQAIQVSLEKTVLAVTQAVVESMRGTPQAGQQSQPQVRRPGWGKGGGQGVMGQWVWWESMWGMPQAGQHSQPQDRRPGWGKSGQGVMGQWVWGGACRGCRRQGSIHSHR